VDQRVTTFKWLICRTHHDANLLYHGRSNVFELADGLKMRMELRCPPPLKLGLLSVYLKDGSPLSIYAKM